MDFIKTLLAYMALLTALSVQEGPLPQDVPQPTAPPPEAIVTFAPFNTDTPTATPGPTAEPVPVLTPSSRYETIRYQDRGDSVRKLQKRLIQLGYMPEGSADGAYGYQTYNAVRDFQRANGLEADGVAGPTTLTNLYENDRIIPKMTATPVPTATPTPTLAPIPTPAPVTPAPVTPTPEALPLPEAPTSEPAEEATEEPAVEPSVEPFTLAEVPDALIISGNTGRALTITQMMDGMQVPLKPQLWQTSAGEPVMSLRDLVDCYTGWSLTGSAAEGRYALSAAGYEVELLLAGDSVRVTADGRSVSLGANDVRYQNGTLYITGEFLRQTLDANVIFDADERSLVLFISDKRISDAND